MIFYRLTDYFQKTLLMEKRISCILRGLPLRNQNGPQTKIFLIRKVLAVIIKSFVTEQRHSLKTGLKKGTEGAGNIFPLPLNGGSHLLPSLQWFFCYQDPGLCYHFTSKFEAAMSA